MPGSHVVKTFRILLISFVLLLLLAPTRAAYDYREALSKSLLYFEAQRSGHLPYHQRVTWRGHSGLTDGLEQGVSQRVDLVGGYYDAGDHVKFGLPMAFTITMLSWGVMENGDAIAAAGEFEHSLEAIKWGTDYFIKAHTHPNVLWAEVGDGDTDHSCWQRPEDMTTSRQAYKIDAEHPGSELAGETAAAMAAASIVFKKTNPRYSHLLLRHAEQLFEFGDKYRGRYHLSVPAAKSYYPSLSGYGDELLWAALWLHRATGREYYLQYAVDKAYTLGGAAWAISEFSWDIKYAGVQILASKVKTFLTNPWLLYQLLMEGGGGGGGGGLPDQQRNTLQQYRSKAEHYLCSCLGMNRNDSNVRRTPGGLLFVRRWNNMQYVAGAAFLLIVFSDQLALAHEDLHCPRGPLSPQEVLSFAKNQMDYVLGSNPMGISYMVGFGPRYPTSVHHRAASTVAYKKDKSFIGCAQGFDAWFGQQMPNPNVLVGAIVGGPGAEDEFSDARGNYMQTEACTYNTAQMVGVFARFSQPERR
ncbi:hypothetical protein B296_00016206 [Ensete ventricosum]|uniref:Endoglucanase n=1 Tax=Ensete ventricosum TaxID=4639 RepID=A0A427B3W1_ENSVE|nr:hypothetical protein B296_00016206 [Ensete ventricosum]